MQIRRNCLLLPTVFLVTLWQYQVAASKRKQTDSILEIMNTREIEQIMAERRLNATREDGNQFLIQNDLDDDFTELPRVDRYRPHRRQQSREVGLDVGYGPGQRRIGDDHRTSGGVLVKYNDSTLLHHPEISGINMQDMIRSDKLLKSSKNALYVTRKEYLKTDWCKTEPLVQRIREPGCLTRTFLNRFCYGQCNSFYIPKSPKRRRNNSGSNSRYSQSDHLEDEDLTAASFRSCGFCKPKKFTWVTITLRCPSLTPPVRKKRVQRIKQCKCMAVPLD